MSHRIVNRWRVPRECFEMIQECLYAFSNHISVIQKCQYIITNKMCTHLTKVSKADAKHRLYLLYIKLFYSAIFLPPNTASK